MIRTRQRGKTFSYSFEAGKDFTGRRKVIEKGGFKTKEDAYDAGVEAYTSFKHGNIGITSEKISIADFSELYEKARESEVRPSRIRIIRQIIRKHINPHLGSFMVQELTPLMVNQWMQILIKKGLAKGTLQGIHAVLHSMMDFAIFPGQLINANPVIKIKIPSSVPDSVMPHRAISLEEFRELLARLTEYTPEYTAAMIQFTCGLRISEVIGLTWDRLDLEHDTLTVDRQLAPYMEFIPPKTKSSTRTILMPKDLTAYLKKLRIRQHENRLKASHYWPTTVDNKGKVWYSDSFEPVSFVLVNDTGRICTRSTVSTRFKKLGITSHSLRHSHATLLVESGATFTDISERLGHARTSTTMNIYSHNTLAQKLHTVQLFENLLNSASRQGVDKG